MIQLPEKPKVVSHDGNKAVFEISPLYPGYGLTIGNALRRVLISSIEGAAITSVKIKGVDHEFSTIEGVMEDAIDVILNLKKVRFRLFSDEPVVLNLKKKGANKITANDIEPNSDVEVINKDQEIATITDKKAEIEMELKIEKGMGYVPVEQRQKEKLGVGSIAVDAIFSPVKNINYKVENMRVGQRTDYNKIILEIETDGSVSPEETLIRASKTLIDYFEQVNQLEVPKEKEATTKTSKKKESTKKETKSKKK
ncbi:MAG: DNA-directed RNA polymerase subunit alpha [Candidatus Yanofskybacteria bacterium CG10_big_fil_rev_8_21_14_0_10_36_16]|uniref:DNA-directed RNA polymerase subunit alpha n=1 Tax=Candidatus Yanofskybacteria bacterium CG10_big_fil_rev_8_21_14_0_10_36_16 TaxID=1975096 RepID=A0A2J0Q7B3_9BACT|nr:MAG: DNA-directed RNA polymerase subunit alpha [Candidatus Yanofskybacteria bacterium CG10_big_fil_rev_8_21_14_0_10_36_16]